MSITAFSHVAIGVRDMEVALPFWRDVVGLRVSLDTIEEMPQGDGKPTAQRRAVYMRWDDDPRSSFVVLDQQLTIETPVSRRTSSRWDCTTTASGSTTSIRSSPASRRRSVTVLAERLGRRGLGVVGRAAR